MTSHHGFKNVTNKNREEVKNHEITCDVLNGGTLIVLILFITRSGYAILNVQFSEIGE